MKSSAEIIREANERIAKTRTAKLSPEAVRAHFAEYLQRADDVEDEEETEDEEDVLE